MDRAELSNKTKLYNLCDLPILITLNDHKTYSINLNDNYVLPSKNSLIYESEFKPSEYNLNNYINSIGIPESNSEVLARVINKTYHGLGENDLQSTEDIMKSHYHSLDFYREMQLNTYGTNKMKKLKIMAREKESQLKVLHEQKLALDRKAYLRVKCFLSMGAVVAMA